MASDGFVNPMENVGATNAQVAQLLASASEPGDLPVISPPADDIVRLPGGLVRAKWGEEPVLLASEATVRELNGADEEAIYKARTRPLRLISTLLSCGTVKLGDHHANSGLLKDLLIGDREALILGIRRATYGDKVDMGDIICPGCDDRLHLTVTLDDIPIKRLDDPLHDTSFSVDLWKGGHAVVRLPNGHDQEAVSDLGENATEAEMNSLMLSRCVQKIVDKDGEEEIVASNIARVNQIGLQDRRAILAAINERQPGPRYDEIKFTHEACGKESPVFLTMGDLFRDL